MSSGVSEAVSGAIASDPVFDRCWWIYSLCRERLFADHTDTIANALGPLLQTQTSIRLLEVGCGPGFYSRRLAGRFPHIQATGVDTSERLLTHARLQAQKAGLENCRFLQADANKLRDCFGEADAAIASRFFLILHEREQVLHAVFETLRPGGLFFVAEPTSELRAAIPLWAMRRCEWVAGRRHESAVGSPTRCDVLSHPGFRELIGSRPWSKVRVWRDKRYQYALCEKAS